MIRPEASAKLRLMAEPIAWGAALLLCLWMTISLGRTASLIVAAVPLLGAAIAGVGFWIALSRIRLLPKGQVKGVVLVDERRVGFFDPDHEGGFVDLDALLRLEIRGDLGARSWVLYHEDGPPLQISQNAPGAEQLIDLFGALPNVGIATISRAFEDEDMDVHLIWESGQTAQKLPVQ